MFREGRGGMVWFRDRGTGGFLRWDGPLADMNYKPVPGT
jgi:hypothetical protein